MLDDDDIVGGVWCWRRGTTGWYALSPNPTLRRCPHATPHEVMAVIFLYGTTFPLLSAKALGKFHIHNNGRYLLQHSQKWVLKETVHTRSPSSARNDVIADECRIRS